jgi:hypothetical protein
MICMPLPGVPRDEPLLIVARWLRVADSAPLPRREVPPAPIRRVGFPAFQRLPRYRARQ